MKISNYWVKPHGIKPSERESKKSLLSEATGWMGSRIAYSEKALGQKAEVVRSHRQGVNASRSEELDSSSIPIEKGIISSAHLDSCEKTMRREQDTAEEPALESPSESGTFVCGKTFWMKFLDDGQSQGTDESSSQRKTPIGREIQGTWSSGSPLSECSAFKPTQETPRSVSSMSDDGADFAPRRKVVASRRWNSEAETFCSNNQENDKYRRASTGDIGEDNSPMPTQRRNAPTPESFPQARATARHFGDVTNQVVNRSTPPTSGITSRPVHQHKAQQKIPDFIENQTFVSKRMQHTATAIGSTELSADENQLQEHEKARKGYTCLQVITAQPHATPTEALGAISPLPDPMIVIGDSLPTPNSVSSSKLQIVKITPRAEAQDRFQWAYDAWHRAGLMEKKVVKRELSPRISQGISHFTTFAPTPSPVESIQHKESTKAIPESSRAASDSGFPELFERFPHHKIEAMPSGESDRSEFQQLLTQWRNKSDDKPNAHFLSPEQETGFAESKATDIQGLKGGGISPKLARPLQFSRSNSDQVHQPETPLVLKRIEAYDRDFFDWARERNSTSPKEKSPGLGKPSSGKTLVSALGDRSVTIVRSSAYGDDKPVARIISSVGIGDSGIYEEDEVMNIHEPSRALVILENKESFEVMVGDGRKDRAQQLVIRNVELVTSNEQEARLTEYTPCECSQSVFSGNDDLISFFLPQMGMACTCGRQTRGLLNPEDPIAIENILRPWQVDFLKSFGIHRGEQLVKARHRSADIMAKGLRQWRKKKGMAPFKTTSCGMAIHIWAKTCKAYVRSVRKQINAGHVLLEHQPGELIRELSHFLTDLPAAPKHREGSMVEIKPDSQVEV